MAVGRKKKEITFVCRSGETFSRVRRRLISIVVVIHSMRFRFHFIYEHFSQKQKSGRTVDRDTGGVSLSQHHMTASG